METPMSRPAGVWLRCWLAGALVIIQLIVSKTNKKKVFGSVSRSAGAVYEKAFTLRLSVDKWNAQYTAVVGRLELPRGCVRLE